MNAECIVPVLDVLPKALDPVPSTPKSTTQMSILLRDHEQTTSQFCLQLSQ